MNETDPVMDRMDRGNPETATPTSQLSPMNLSFTPTQ